MNILYLIRAWPVLRCDYLFRELQWMQRAGHRVAAAGVEFVEPEYDAHSVLPSYDLDGIPELLLDDDPDPTDRLVAFAREQRIDLIDAHDGRRTAELALELHRRTGIPFTVRFHGGDLHTSPTRRLGEIAAAARALCPISRYLAGFLGGPRARVDADPARLRVCPHGMPSEFVASAPAIHDRDELEIGTISRLDHPTKCAPFDLVRAFGRVAAEFPRASLRFIGGGELQPPIERLARKLGVGERVHITGFVPWHEAQRLASQLDVFVHGSRAEGFCLPVLEAAANGLPLAVTRTGVSEEIVDEGVNGYLFDYGDSETLAARLRLLLSAGAESRRQMGVASLARVRERFLFEDAMPRMERIFDAAVSGGPLPS